MIKAPGLNEKRPGILAAVETKMVAAEALAPSPLPEPSVSVSKSITRRRQDDDVKEDRSEIRRRAYELVDEAFAALAETLRDKTVSAQTRVTAAKLVIELAKATDDDETETQTVTSSHMDALRSLAQTRSPAALPKTAK